jgi:hypothetical protein
MTRFIPSVMGAKVTGLNNKWDIGADLTYSQSTGAIDLSNRRYSSERDTVP